MVVADDGAGAAGGVVLAEGGGSEGAAGAGETRVVKPRPLAVLPDSGGLESWVNVLGVFVDEDEGSAAEVEAKAAACDVRDLLSPWSSLGSLWSL